jgi:leucine dehydrogenase
LELFNRLKANCHEQIIFFREQISGLRSIVSIHDTTLGPAIGGVRMWQYTDEDEAVEDALKLSRSMTYKAAGAGLNFGGGQAVIIGDPKTCKTESLFRSLGRFIDSLGGRYIAAEGLGTTVEDMDYIRMETSYVVGIPRSRGGSGDPSPMCAAGVLGGLEACQAFLTGDDSLKAVRVAVQGVGKVGSILVHKLVAQGAIVTVADIDPDAAGRVGAGREITVVPAKDIYGVECDIFCPCALGGIINDDTIEKLHCKVVAGAANNQLAEERHGTGLHNRGILYAPDYIVNAGGLINVTEEIYGYDRKRATRKTAVIKEVLLKILISAREQDIPTFQAADRFAEARIERVGRVRRSYVSS